MTRTIALGSTPVTVDELVALAHGQARVEISPEPALRERIARGVAVITEQLSRGQSVYGVSTGFGASGDMAQYWIVTSTVTGASVRTPARR